MSHKRGISRVDIDDETITNFTVRVANRGYEFMDGAGYRDSITGRLYFGGLDGYVSFLPDKMQGNQYPPEARITHLYLNNERVLPGREVGGKVLLKKPVYLTSSLVLDYDQRNFALEFSAMHYANPAHNRYAYYLEGFDSDWVEGDGRFRRAVYNGLPPGDYVFRLKAANSNGVWHSQETSLAIRILPPWWRGPLAYIGYFLVLLLIVMGVYYVFLVKWRLKHQIELERFEIDKLKEMQSLRSRFFTSISHELRTPLTLILDPVERMINTEITPEDKGRYLSLIQKNAQRLLRLLNQLLAFKRIESGHESFNWQPAALQKLLYAIYASFEVKAATRGIDYRFESELPQLLVWADVDKMEKVFYNLLGNAFKYTPQGGRISMEVSEVAGRKREPDGPVYVQIIVRDSGEGIAPEIQNQIFELFYKANELADQNSNGVGLAYIRELVLLHKGEISVESQVGKGACFKVVLPLTVVNDQSITADLPASFLTSVDDGDPSASLEAGVDVEISTILLVEDDHDIRNYMAETLQPFYQVLQASNGQMGFERALKNHPDLVITDVVMPELSGLELCEKLRNDMRTCFIPVIMLTSLSDSEAHVEGVESGADVYLTKPFQSTLLLAQIRRLLASRDQIRERLIAIAEKGSSEPSPASVEEAPVDEFLSRVRQHVEEGVFDVQELAECLHLSRTQLYRKVKATSGQSVSELVTGIRMKFATDLLRSGENNVNEVADRLGYSEPGNFSRAFQKYYGQTPRSFMQNR
ncbi:hybrid sensor histidine kinase/response regulator transcription factor [Geofilum rubicundum]|uniref:histidine kinase n=1 Tax=Geofilum rubicundum JCM 15548 TaxID=1236989 RepID=A0A0E9LX60_9BACT|nr:ATP-binding protein [Geofilum rubicundum]GAO29435.1 DNA-binding response regulator, AraC family [Geofilum rubicundum JCM 15548]